MSAAVTLLRVAVNGAVTIGMVVLIGAVFVAALRRWDGPS